MQGVFTCLCFPSAVQYLFPSSAGTGWSVSSDTTATVWRRDSGPSCSRTSKQRPSRTLREVMSLRKWPRAPKLQHIYTHTGSLRFSGWIYVTARVCQHKLGVSNVGAVVCNIGHINTKPWRTWSRDIQINLWKYVSELSFRKSVFVSTKPSYYLRMTGVYTTTKHVLIN